MPRIQPTIAVSSWSLHRTIGLSWWDSPSGPAVQKAAWGNGTLPILEVPAAIAAHGIRQMHLCHFHVPSRDAGWLRDFRSSLGDAGVTLSMLLIDDGDITDPGHHKRDAAWIAGWIDTAAELGAVSARVVAGKQAPTPETLQRSAEGLRALVQRGSDAGVRIVTENWHDLLNGPDEVETILGAVDGLGLLADFGNWKGADKYDKLARILPWAEDTHAKAAFSDAGVIDGDDFGRCIDLAAAVGYDGPYTLIYDSPDPDEWTSIAVERRFVLDRLAAAAGEAA